MPYEEKLAERIRALFPTDVAYTEKKMFGGLAFLINGNMSITVSGKGGILVRVDPQVYEQVCKEPGVETAVMRGKKMNGWLRVLESQLRTKKQLLQWLTLSVAFANSLPAKNESISCLKIREGLCAPIFIETASNNGCYMRWILMRCLGNRFFNPVLVQV